MEIIHVLIGKINPSRMSGIGKLVHDLALQQSNAGAKVSLWGISRFASHDYPGRHYDTFMFRAHRNGRKLDKRLKMSLEAKKSDTIFHLHGGFSPAFYQLAKIFRHLHIPYVFSPHGSYDRRALEKNRLRKQLYLRFFEKKIWQHAEMIHCLGPVEAEQLQRLYPNKKTILIRYGYKQDEERKPFISQDNQHFIVGYSGRLDIHAKGLDTLIKGFAIFQKQVPSARLWITGNGKEKSRLKKLVFDTGIIRKTVFRNSLFGEEKLALLSQMQILAQPSRYEDLPATVLEAASLGIPCLVTEATNLGDAVRRYDCGEVIDASEPLALAAGLLDLYTRLQCREAGELSENAKRMIREEFDWKSALRNFEQLYEPA